MVDAIFPPGANGKDNKQAEAIKNKLRFGAGHAAKGVNLGTDIGMDVAKNIAIGKAPPPAVLLEKLPLDKLPMADKLPLSKFGLAPKKPSVIPKFGF